MQRTVKAIGFDFDHTLGIDNKLERVAFLRLLEPRRALADETERIDALLVEQRAGAFSIEEAVRRFVTERGVRADDAHSYVQRYKAMCVEMVPSLVIPEPGLRELCEGLDARSVPHAILTNGWSPLQQAKARNVRYTGAVIVSADIGAQKPSREAFSALAKTFGVQLDELAYVGDSPSGDVAGALDCGAFAVWYDAEHIPYPDGMPAPSARIHRLTELLSLV